MGKSKFDKSCSVCQSAYKYCSGCSDYASYPRWMQSFCSDNCRKIFNIYMMHKAGVKNNAEAKVELLKCDLSKKDQFDDTFKKSIESILADPAKAVKSPKVGLVEEPAQIEEPKAEEENIEEQKNEDVKVEVENAEEEPAFTTQSQTRSKNKFSGYKKATSKKQI